MRKWPVEVFFPFLSPNTSGKETILDYRVRTDVWVQNSRLFPDFFLKQ